MESEERSKRSSEWMGASRSMDMNTMITRKREPASAYQYYQQLVQDFDSLEREMEIHQEEQSGLEAQLERAQTKIRASQAQDRQVQQLQWERERDRQLENFVQQRTALDDLRAQTEALEAQELRLQAEMEVLHEQQKESSETEARRIRRLVHERTTLLEDELTKGKLDLDYIAQVVSSSHRKEQNREAHQESCETSVQTLVQEIQERRRQEFDVAEANLKVRIRSFQLEQDVLAQKANELRVTKQRAIQILSQNQQIAIKGFFDTVPNIQHEDKPSSSPLLDFGEILQSLNQSGVQVEQIQTIDSEKHSGRREFAEALQEARATLERGNQRVEAIQKSLLDRKNDAQRLGITVDLPGANHVEYDGNWGIETYSPRQYEMVYFIRRLVFSWMDNAVTEVNSQPAKELLEFEVQRWGDTHTSIDRDCTRDRILRLAGQILATLTNEAVTEIAADIRMEFESTAHRVRSIYTNAFKRTLFPAPSEKLNANKVPSKPKPPLTSDHSTLRSSLFEASLEHLRRQRNRRNDPKSIALLHTICLPVSRSLVTASVVAPSVQTKSPAKKMFGAFGRSRVSESPTKREVPLPTHNSTTPSEQKEVEIMAYMTPNVPTSLSSASKIAMTFWQNEPHLRLQTILVPSSRGFSSCLQLSPNGDLLVCGTTEGEIVLWDLLPDQPAVLRVWSPPKAERSRITRVVLSPDAQVLMVSFRRKTIGVFAINSNPARPNSQTKPKQAMHSEECFPLDHTKCKPRNLELLFQLATADALAELSFTNDVRERAPNAVAKDPISSWSAAELSCGSFFSSISFTGMTAGNTSLLFGTSIGDLLKLNTRPEQENKGLRLQDVQATFDSPSPDSNDLLNSNCIRREFFRGHRKPVLFASCIHRSNRDVNVMEIVSVDQAGIVCIWEYSTTQFTGFGWFEPKLKTRLELACSNSHLISSAGPTITPPRFLQQQDKSGANELTGEILQVALTPDHTRLVCMVFYADPSKKEVAGTLRFLQIRTASMQLDRMIYNVDFVGGNGAPRFALTTNFMLLLAKNLVHVYTLRTGIKAREPISLAASGQQQLAFTNITCIATSKTSLHTKLDSSTNTAEKQRVQPTKITFVVSGDQHPCLLVHTFTASTSQSPGNKINGKRVR